MNPIYRSKILYHIYVKLASLPFNLARHEGFFVMGQNWDNLIVLDACRYDTFERLNRIEGNLKRVRSVATSTPQWLKRNFPGSYNDVVYVAGNPYVSRLASEGYFDAEEHFNHVEHVWDHGWDDKLGTVPPETINREVRELKEKYPDSRFIVHYMQPHEPFIGKRNFIHIDEVGWPRVKEVWLHPDIEKAYEDNLELVLEAIKDLLPDLNGKTVITSDHGEVFGKYGLIRHPKGVFLKELYEVPWLEVKD